MDFFESRFSPKTGNSKVFYSKANEQFCNHNRHNSAIVNSNGLPRLPPYFTRKNSKGSIEAAI